MNTARDLRVYMCMCVWKKAGMVLLQKRQHHRALCLRCLSAADACSLLSQHPENSSFSLITLTGHERRILIQLNFGFKAGRGERLFPGHHLVSVQCHSIALTVCSRGNALFQVSSVLHLCWRRLLFRLKWRNVEQFAIPTNLPLCA